VSIKPHSKLDSVIFGNDHFINRFGFGLKAALSYIAAFLIIALPIWTILIAIFASSGAIIETLKITAAKLITFIGGGNFPIKISLDGETLRLTAAQIASSLDERYSRHVSVFVLSFIVAAIPASLALKKVTEFLRKIGSKMQAADHLRGAKIVTPEQLNEVIDEQQHAFRDMLEKKGQKAPEPLMKLKIGSVTLPDNRETAGFLLLGSTGSGKTVAQKELCRQVREANQKMVIYDPAPEFVCEFWRRGDIIINPFDERTAPWSIWHEVRSIYDYKAFAEAIIELDPKYASFSQSARLVLAAILKKTTNLDEFKTALAQPLEDMDGWLRDTSAAGIISVANSRGSETVLGMIRQRVSAFYFMNDPLPGEETFSFRKWVSDDDDRRWVFLVCPEDQRSILAPLITLYFDMISRELMTLVPNSKLPFERQRRVWMMLEELPSLPIIPALEGLTAKGRKYGAVWVLTAQDPGQIEKTYSKELAAAIMQCCNTWLVFRSNAAETAKKISALIGQYEEMEKRISHSMGIEENRDGTSVSQQKIVRDAVLPSEIQTLQDLQHYLIIFGPYPRCKQTIPFEAAPEVQPGVVLKKGVAIPAQAAFAPSIAATTPPDRDDRPQLVHTQHTALVAEKADLGAFFSADAKKAEEPVSKFSNAISAPSFSPKDDDWSDVEADVESASTETKKNVLDF